VNGLDDGLKALPSLNIDRGGGRADLSDATACYLVYGHIECLSECPIWPIQQLPAEAISHALVVLGTTRSTELVWEYTVRGQLTVLGGAENPA
jgi:hypothetical protein